MEVPVSETRLVIYRVKNCYTKAVCYVEPNGFSWSDKRFDKTISVEAKRRFYVMRSDHPHIRIHLRYGEYTPIQVVEFVNTTFNPISKCIFLDEEKVQQILDEKVVKM